MSAEKLLARARRRAGMTQRELAEKAGMSQSVVARIESGRSIPRTDTLERLLKACGHRLEAEPRRGEGVDRSLIRELRKLTPQQRADHAVRSWQNLRDLRENLRWTTSPSIQGERSKR